MNKTTRSLNNKNIVLLAISAFVTLFLFYIDEGYYNFKWMLDAGNWVVFLLYLGILFSIQWVFLQILTYKTSSLLINVLKYGIGLLIALRVAFWIFS
jgi:hypothetical protein